MFASSPSQPCDRQTSLRPRPPRNVSSQVVADVIEIRRKAGDYLINEEEVHKAIQHKWTTYLDKEGKDRQEYSEAEQLLYLFNAILSQKDTECFQLHDLKRENEALREENRKLREQMKRQNGLLFIQKHQGYTSIHEQNEQFKQIIENLKEELEYLKEELKIAQLQIKSLQEHNQNMELLNKTEMTSQASFYETRVRSLKTKIKQLCSSGECA